MKLISPASFKDWAIKDHWSQHVRGTMEIKLNLNPTRQKALEKRSAELICFEGPRGERWRDGDPTRE